MSIGRALARSASRQIVKEINRSATYHRVQREAAARPESTRVETPFGQFWMSPIESKLYEAMCREGLSPIPQFRIEGYIADFAFPDVGIVVEADGVVYHSGERREHDRKRDWIMRREGWTVKRFNGTTIHHEVSNCAHVIKQEVVRRRVEAASRARLEELKRLERRAALLRPVRRVIHVLKRSKRREGKKEGV